METQELFLPLPDHDMTCTPPYPSGIGQVPGGGGVLRLAPGDWRIASLRDCTITPPCICPPEPTSSPATVGRTIRTSTSPPP